MKTKIFCWLVFQILLIGLTCAQSPNVSVSNPPTGLTMCGSKENFAINITNNDVAAISNRIFTVSVAHTGIYFYNPQSNHEDVVVSSVPSSGATTFSFEVQSLAPTESATINFEGHASCAVAIGGNTL